MNGHCGPQKCGRLLPTYTCDAKYCHISQILSYKQQLGILQYLLYPLVNVKLSRRLFQQMRWKRHSVLWQQLQRNGQTSCLVNHKIHTRTHAEFVRDCHLLHAQNIWPWRGQHNKAPQWYRRRCTETVTFTIITTSDFVLPTGFQGSLTVKLCFTNALLLLALYRTLTHVTKHTLISTT